MYCTSHSIDILNPRRDRKGVEVPYLFIYFGEEIKE